MANTNQAYEKWFYLTITLVSTAPSEVFSSESKNLIIDTMYRNASKVLFTSSESNEKIYIDLEAKIENEGMEDIDLNSVIELFT